MLKKIVFRNLLKNKSNILVNILGLSIGLTSCILIFSYINFEISYDTYHEKSNEIFRVESKSTVNGRVSEASTCPLRYAPTLVNDFPEVIDAVRFSRTVERSFSYNDIHYFQDGVVYTGQSVFNIFSFELIVGNPETALKEPYTMVLTEETARRYFGDENPLGKIIRWDNSANYTVTGVVKTPPLNTHFTFNVLASFSTFFAYSSQLENLWLEWFVPTYILLKENTDYKEFEKKLPGFVENHLGDKLKANNAEFVNTLRPVKNIHLHSKLAGELGENGDIKMIYVLLSIAIGILLIACFNFINLATASTSQRAKEVGIRKVLGAYRFKIAGQFFRETMVHIFLSLFIAILLAQIFLPTFNFITNREISINYLNMPLLTMGLFGSVLLVLFVAGSYPAFLISGLNPINAMKGIIIANTKKSFLRSILVVLQFVISACLIIFAMIIYNQQKFMQNKDLGFDKENILVVALQNKDVRVSPEVFKNELLTIKGVESICASSMVPGEMYLFNNSTYPEGSSKEDAFRMQNFFADYDFCRTLGVEIIKGRGFEKDIISDVADAILINETAANELGWDEPIGKTIEIVNNFNNANPTEIRKVIGVYKDFHHRSLYSAIEPTFIRHISNEGPIEHRARRLSLHLQTNDFVEVTQEVEQKWKAFYPNIPFHYFYLGESYDSKHMGEKNLGRIIGSFSIIAILIGCIGLFGLASFSIEKRLKEIVIRKIFGSNIKLIVWLLCKDYLRLVIISNIIALPIAYYFSNQWLQNFPYAVPIHISVFLIALIFSLIIAFLVVIFNSLKASHKNPIEILQYE